MAKGNVLFEPMPTACLETLVPQNPQCFQGFAISKPAVWLPEFTSCGNPWLSIVVQLLETRGKMTIQHEIRRRESVDVASSGILLFGLFKMECWIQTIPIGKPQKWTLFVTQGLRVCCVCVCVCVSEWIGQKQFRLVLATCMTFPNLVRQETRQVSGNSPT